jgi:hypothetical protein
MIRRIFWNLKGSFFGMGMLTSMPLAVLYWPLVGGIPLYTVSVLQSGFKMNLKFIFLYK